MSDKMLRILVADDQHFQRLKIQRMLNQLGYFRIAPVQSFDEVEALTRFLNKPFDLLIVNSALVEATDIDIDEFCRENPLIHHALIYDSQKVNLPFIDEPMPAAVQINLSGAPESDCLRGFMDIIDSLCSTGRA
ncbi:response regulator [Pseudomonas plecoglossicida]|uniref:response regulator n=1 Tax=Pseudomonas plecoglossicida TaxID=70775 RepID=UPI0015E27B84|nr:response regulator [Pseudomonas plecoglossicida]MBA1197001.1 response regulator [Pseudomonas plecoglossicida]